MNEQTESPAMPEIIKLGRIKVSERIFESHGTCLVKVTHHGIVKLAEIEIRSTGVAEVMRKLYENRPEAPPIHTVVVGGTEAGNELKLKPGERKAAYMPNLADPAYIAKKEAWQADLTLEVVNQGVANEFVDDDDRVLTTREDRLQALRNMGLTTAQFAWLSRKIEGLTQFTEQEEELFFGVSSASGSRPAS